MNSFMQHAANQSPSILIFGASVTIFALLRFIWPSQWLKFVDLVESKKFWLPLSVILLASYLVLLGFVASYSGFIDHVEPGVVSVSAFVSQGNPLYHGLESPRRYSLLYGPMSYLPYVWALRLLGEQVLSVKLVVLFAHLGLVALLWNSYRTRMNWRQTTLATALVIIFLMAGEPYLIEARGDVIMVLAAAIGLAGALRSSRWQAGLLLALGAGLCTATKITGGLYFVPLFILLYRRFGARVTGLALLGATAVASFPFALPEVSLTNYWLWLREASHHPLGRHEFLRNVRALVMLSIPALVLAWRLYERDREAWFAYLRRERVFLLALGISVALTTVTASKIGAGEHHYLPFYPLLGFVCCDLYRQTKTIREIPRRSLRLTVSAVFSLWLASTVGTRVAWGLNVAWPHVFTGRAAALSIANDLREIMRRHPGEKIEIGYSGKFAKVDDLTTFRPILIFAGNPLTVDEAALEDMKISGLNVPESTITYLDSCGTPIWLIPKNEDPFILPAFDANSHFVPIRDIFGDTFRRAFFDHYQRQSTSIYFDLWTCKNGAAK